MYMSGYIMGIDPSTFATLFASDSPDNYSHVADTSLDGLFAKGAVETDTAKQRPCTSRPNSGSRRTPATSRSLRTNESWSSPRPSVGWTRAALVPVYTFEDS